MILVVILWVSLSAACVGAAALLFITTPDVSWLQHQAPRDTPLMRRRHQDAAAQHRASTPARRDVPLSTISQNLVRAVLVAEDPTFFTHRGIAWTSVRRSIRRTLETRTWVGGSSTITQQLARIVFLAPTRSLPRKLQEFVLTVTLEAALSKARILELYLDLVEWGDGIYGAEAAAQAYFQKPASELTLAEAIRLASILPNPRRWTVSDRSPTMVRRRVSLAGRYRRDQSLSDEAFRRLVAEVQR